MLSKNKERKLIEMYPHTEDSVIAKVLGIGTWLVQKKAEELGLVKDEESNDWCNSHIEYLIEKYPLLGNDDLSEYLGRSKSEIEHFAFRLGLSKNPDFFSNIYITTEERALLDEWNNQYNKAENGSSRGNFVLGKILEHIYPLSNIIPEYPIGNLRLDYYAPRMLLGFEFQGIQHTEYNSFHFKTKADFVRAQNRDYAKSEMCESMGIAVVYIHHDEELSISLVRAKINQVM